MPKVLILDAESSAGLECAQSLGRAGAQVHLASPVDALAFRSKYCHTHHDQPANPEQIVEWLNALDQTYHFDLVIPSTERSLLAFATTDCNEDLYRKAVLADRDMLLSAMNKEDVLRRAVAIGLPVPQSSLVTSTSMGDHVFDFPVAVKPVKSKAVSDGTVLDLRVQYARDPNELLAIVSALPGLSFQVQKLVQGHGVGIELLFDRGEPVLSFAHERVHEWPLTGGGSCYRKAIPAPPDLLRKSVQLLQTMNWHGVAMVEWKVDRTGAPMLMEINPRLWGSLALAIDAGVDFPRALLSIAQGTSLPSQLPYKTPYYTRDITRDLDWQFANLRAPRNNPQLLVQPRLMSALQLLRPIIFQESWDFFDIRDLPVLTHRMGHYFRGKFRAVFGKLKRKLRERQFIRTPHRRLLESGSRPSNIVFLCYGNICRSPLAALIAQQELPAHTIHSAGFHQIASRQSPAHMQQAAAKLGIDMQSHRSRTVTIQDLTEADLIFVMDWKNYNRLIEFYPEAANKTTFLGLFGPSGPFEIEDPYELRGARVDDVAKRIQTSVKAVGTWLSPSQP